MKHFPPLTIIDKIAWFGVLLILCTYAVVRWKLRFGYTKTYHLCNLVGGLAVLVGCAYYRLWSVCVLNLVWTWVALRAIREIGNNNEGENVNTERT